MTISVDYILQEAMEARVCRQLDTYRDFVNRPVIDAREQQR